MQISEKLMLLTKVGKNADLVFEVSHLIDEIFSPITQTTFPDIFA
jgi:hypothetical protein